MEKGSLEFEDRDIAIIEAAHDLLYEMDNEDYRKVVSDLHALSNRMCKILYEKDETICSCQNPIRMESLFLMEDTACAVCFKKIL